MLDRSIPTQKLPPIALHRQLDAIWNAGSGIKRFAAVNHNVIGNRFWVPRLGGKIDSIPGQINTITLLADIEGTFGGVCSEYCGEGHAGMNFRVQAHEKTDYENALRTLTP